ncbi:MAG: sugar ABC transporter permease [Anaerolineae bacterium]|nr:sugar ABC transporter permease [Anaerolineae bacterium]
MLASLYFAFTDYRAVTAPTFTGLANFSRMAKDRYFLISLGNTAFYTFLGVPAFQLSALLMALALNSKIHGTSVYRTIYYLPSVMPAVANAVLWVWIFNPEFGFANVVLRWFGLPGLAWLADPRLAKPCFIIMGMWATGASMLIYLAGLQGVPEALYEAADMDGAGTLRKFLYVTIPMITPTIFFNLVIGFIGSFQVFTTAYVATGGGPVNATLFYVLYLYQMAFQSFWMGYASALAWVLFVIILIFTIIQVRLSSRWVYYESA